MNEKAFIQRYRSTWRRFDRLLEECETSEPTEPVDELPPLYRQLCQQLSIAQQRGYRPSVIERLNGLVERGHAQLYGSRKGRWAPIFDYIKGGFARDVRANWKLFVLSALLFYGPFFGMFLWLQYQPEWGYHVLGPARAAKFEQMYASPAVRPPDAADSDFLMFGFYIFNNISIALRTFASGMVAGLGALAALVFNGTFLGAAAGHVQNAGHGVNFWQFVIGHGAFELTAIVLAGQAGLKLGFAPIWPGRRTRMQALREEAHDSVGLIAGFFIMLVIAAFIEAFWSPSTAPARTKFLVGGLLWLLVGMYLGLAGRGHGSG